MQTAGGPLDDGNVTPTAAAIPGAPPGAAWSFLAAWEVKCLTEPSHFSHSSPERLHQPESQQARLDLLHSGVWANGGEVLLQEHGKVSVQWESQGAGSAPCLQLLYHPENHLKNN